VFKRLSQKANLKHVRHDYTLSRQAEDEAIYTLATQEKMIIITQDEKFRKQIKSKGTGIIVIPSYLTNEEIEALIILFISGKNPQDYQGKVTKV